MSCIDNNNLLLGDYVVYKDQIYTVFKSVWPNEVGLVNNTCGEVHVYLFNTCHPEDTIYPVKLTKELLEQNGFSLVDNCTSKWSYTDEYGNTIIISGSCDGALCQSITIYTNSSSVANGYYRVVSELPITGLHDVQHLLKQLHIKKEWKLQTH